jgi:hypothetical protein
MAGTIVADTIQDGAGNSTAMDNAIYGSAKAWVNWNGTNGTRYASYNVSSVTRNGTGDYTINFTNAFTDANYATSWSGSQSNNWTGSMQTDYSTPRSTTALRVLTTVSSTFSDPTYVSLVFFR